MTNQWFKRPTKQYFLSIDGGTSTVGLCLFCQEDEAIRVLDTRLLLGHFTKDEEDTFDYIKERQGELTYRLYLLKERLKHYIEATPHPICQVIYESHFINPRRPNSVIPLARFMQVVEEVCVDYGLTIDYIAPQQMKKTIGVTGKLAKADKEAVKKAILTLSQEKKLILPLHFEQCSEHEIDAIGIGYTWCQLLK